MNIICQLKLKQPKYTYYLITKQLRTSLLILMLRQSTNSSVCDLQREPRLCTLMSAERDTGDTAPVQSLGEFGCLWRWAQKSSSLFSGRSGWGQTQHFLNVLEKERGFRREVLVCNGSSMMSKIITGYFSSTSNDYFNNNLYDLLSLTQ